MASLVLYGIERPAESDTAWEADAMTASAEENGGEEITEPAGVPVSAVVALILAAACGVWVRWQPEAVVGRATVAASAAVAEPGHAASPWMQSGTEGEGFGRDRSSARPIEGLTFVWTGEEELL